MNNISKTLYIPLYGKALVSRKGIILNDPDAEKIWAGEAFPLKGKAKSKWLAYSMSMRAAVFDSWVREQLDQEPHATVLHIGCGLDSRIHRIGNHGSWYDIDLPDVIRERRRYYIETENDHMLAGDASDPIWLDRIPHGHTGIVVLEGLSMYLPEQKLRQLLAAVNSHFDHIHVLMDCYTTFGAKASRYKNPINTVGVTETYGIDDPAALARDAGIVFVREHDMAPEEMIRQLKGWEAAVFRKLFAGAFAKKIYRMYSFATGGYQEKN